MTGRSVMPNSYGSTPCIFVTPFVTPSRPMRPSLSGVVPRHHPDDPQTGAAPQRSINLKTRPCTVCLHGVLRKDLERLINGIPRNPRGRGEADPKAFAAGGTPTLVNWRPLHALQFYIAFESPFAEAWC